MTHQIFYAQFRAATTAEAKIANRLVYADWLEEQGETKNAKDVRKEVADHAVAIALCNRLAEVGTEDVSVLATDRGLPRKEQAKLARELFKRLGLKGIGVTVPMYSMASVVEVRIPTRLDWYIGPDDVLRRECKNRELDRQVQRTIEAILAVAFPNHDDRSDSQTDYYDSRWSVGMR